MLLKLTEIEQNWIIFMPYGFIKNLWQICLRDSHVKFTGKNKVWQCHVSKVMQLDWSKTAKHFSLYSRRKFLCQLASSFPFSDFYILLSPLGCYFSGLSCIFHFGQCLVNSYQLLLIFTEVWSYNFHISLQDFLMAGFFLQ